MTFRCRPAWALAALGLVLAACGASEPDRFDLRTPGARTGELPITPPAPRETPSATATPSPKAAKPKPISRAERRVIRGWSEALRHGHVSAASHYFSVPAKVWNATPDWVFLDSVADVKQFNRGLPCGAKLVKLKRAVDRFIVAMFELTERPGAGECGTGTGNLAAVAFRIEKGRITQWVRVEAGMPDSGASPTPTPTPGATPPPRTSSA